MICFPFAQHYIADSPGCHTSVKDREDMIGKYNDLAETNKMKTFSAKTIIRQIAMSWIVSMVVIIVLGLLL